MAKTLCGKLPVRPRRYEGEPEQPYWPTFIEKLLLAIIDAYPATLETAKDRAESKDRQDRLDRALLALFRAPRPRGNRRLYQLHALIAAADAAIPSTSQAQFEEYLGIPKKERTRAVSKRKSVATSATEAIGISAAASAQRLTREERTSRDYLAQIAMFRSHDEEEDMLRDLRVVEAVFAKWNIALSVDVEALGMASLWSRKRP